MVLALLAMAVMGSVSLEKWGEVKCGRCSLLSTLKLSPFLDETESSFSLCLRSKVVNYFVSHA